jgi:hypothetical protein
MFQIIKSKETSHIATVTESTPNEGENRNNMRREASRHFRDKKRECLKDKINERVTNSANKDIVTYMKECTNLKAVTNLEVA